MSKNVGSGYTDHLNRRPAENICHAFDYATYLGRPLNTSITINFDDESADHCQGIFRTIRHKYRDWWNRKTKQVFGEALPPLYVYVHENPDGHTHCNWILHVPPELKNEFEKKCHRWIEKAHKNVRGFDICMKAVKAGTEKTICKYIIKGIDPLYVDYLHLKDYAAPQGRVWGRRASTSPAISRGARKGAGFVAKRDRGTRLVPVGPSKARVPARAPRRPWNEEERANI